MSYTAHRRRHTSIEMSLSERERMELERELERLHAESFGWALACCRHDAEDAADALQAAYVKVLSGAARFGGRSSVRTWLFGVIRLTALEEQRRSGRHRRLEPAGSNALVASDKLPDESAERAERRERLMNALATLSPRQREVLHLVFYHDISIAEAAVVMRISVGSARQHYTRGKENLSKLLVSEMHEDVHAR
jgi:RNA polymerase sigma factor (sigma-70 family)